jgi:ketosteroid isomerase-like protein
MGQSRSVVERMLALADARDRDSFEALIAPDAEFEMPGMSARGREAIGGFGRAWDRAFTGGRHTIRNVVEEGEGVVVEVGWTGTHAGPLVTPQGEIAATDRAVSLGHVLVVRVADNLVASTHVYLDMLGLMSQLGLVPQPAAS